MLTTDVVMIGKRFFLGNSFGLGYRRVNGSLDAENSDKDKKDDMKTVSPIQYWHTLVFAIIGHLVSAYSLE